jgi:hypothetical protein
MVCAVTNVVRKESSRKRRDRFFIEGRGQYSRDAEDKARTPVKKPQLAGGVNKKTPPELQPGGADPL